MIWLSVGWFLALALMTGADGHAQGPGPSVDPIIMRIIKLEHADAGNLVLTLEPLLSAQGHIKAYAPNNSLIIVDRPSIDQELIRVIKGPSDPKPVDERRHA